MCHGNPATAHCLLHLLHFTACVKIQQRIHVKNLVLPIKLYEALIYSYFKKGINERK